jgi:ribosomal protein L18
MTTNLIKNVRRERRSMRVRTKLRRVSTMPRLSVHRSLKPSPLPNGF